LLGSNSLVQVTVGAIAKLNTRKVAQKYFIMLLG
jgi:hypothetical protein